MENPSDTTAPPLHEEGGQTRRIARSTAVFSLATAVSRVLGLVREMVSAYYFGVAGAINAFTVAIQIPNLVRALVADAALSGAFVPGDEVDEIRWLARGDAIATLSYEHDRRLLRSMASGAVG